MVSWLNPSSIVSLVPYVHHYMFLHICIFMGFFIFIFQTYASIQLVTMFVKGIPPIIFALFIGPWSDKFGRKFLIVFPLIGYAFYNIWFFINVLFYDYFVVEFLMLEVIQFWFGGFMCLFLGLYSYVSDISEHKTRTVRIAFVDFVLFVALSIGSGILITSTCYFSIFLFCF